MSIGDFLARSCARIHLVLRGRVSSDGLISGAGSFTMSASLYDAPYVRGLPLYV